MAQDTESTVGPNSAALLGGAQDVLWGLLVILTPLWVNLWGQQPFELPKVVLVRTFVWLLAGLAMANLILAARRPKSDRRARPLWGSVFILAVVVAVTTVTAVDWRLSLFGSYDRGQGALTLLTYLLLFFLAALQFRSFRRIRLLLTAMALVGAPLVLLSLAEAAGWRPLGLVSDARAPIVATLGRANFVGGYLVILIPLTLALMMAEMGRGRRWGWMALAAGEIAVIGLTLVRGAWLGAAVALAALALAWWEPRLARGWRALGWCVLGLLALVGPLAVILTGAAGSGSTAARRTIWQATLTLIARRPLLGYGADSLGLVFPAVYPPNLVYDLGRAFFVDRAHNLLLDWGVVAGLPGILSLGLVLFLALGMIAGALRRSLSPSRRALLAGILAAVLGNLAHNLVSFDVTATAAATWLLLGVGVALAGPDRLPARPPAQETPPSRLALAILPLVGIIAAVWLANGRPLAADIAARTANLALQGGRPADAVAAAEQAVRFWPLEPAHHLLLARTAWEQAQANPARSRDWLAQAEQALAAARRARPLEKAVWLQTADFYTAAAHEVGADTHALADEAYRQALALSPASASSHTAWGEALLARGDPAAAAPLLRQAVALDASHGRAYLSLGAAELALGRVEVALADYREAARLLPASAEAYAGLAAAYWQLGRSTEALAAAEEALALDPTHPDAVALRRLLVTSP